MRSGFNVETVKAAEGDIGVGSGCVVAMGGAIDGHAKVDSKFGVQLLECPGLSDGLPGRWGQVDHFLAAPSVS